MSEKDQTTIADGSGKVASGSAAPKPESGPSAPTGARTRLRRASRGRPGTVAAIILFGIFAILVWEFVFRLDIFSRFIVPSAFTTLKDIYQIFGNVFTGGVYLKATLTTLEEIAVGFALGGVAGLFLGIIIGETAFGRRILMPYVVGFNAMPKVAFAPLLVAGLGFGLGPKIALAAIISFFPIVVNTAAGIESPTGNELMLFRAIEATRWKTLWKLKFPTALPFIFAGLKIASVLAVIGAVMGELMSGESGGLGKRITLATMNLHTDTIFAIIVLLSVVGLVVFMVVVVAEHYIVHWRQPKWRPRR